MHGEDIVGLGLGGQRKSSRPAFNAAGDSVNFFIAQTKSSPRRAIRVRALSALSVLPVYCCKCYTIS
jgi:hypothetical protein